MPASSPNLNPVEHAFRKLKLRLHQAGARTREALADAITAALPQPITADAQAWIRHCGYGQTGQPF